MTPIEQEELLVLAQELGAIYYFDETYVMTASSFDERMGLNYPSRVDIEDFIRLFGKWLLGNTP